MTVFKILLTLVVIALAPSLAYSQETALQFLETGKEFVKKGKYQEAIKHFDAAIRLDSQFVEALIERSKARQNNQRDLDGAMEDLQAALQLAPSNGEAYFVRARLRNSLILRQLQRDGPTLTRELLPRYQEILDDLNAAIANGYQNKESYRYRASIYSRRFQKRTEAIADLTVALGYDPKDVALYNNRAWQKNQSGDPDGAIEDQERIVRIYEEAKALAEDRESSELARLKRAAVMAINNISSIYAMQERPDLQLGAIEKSLELEPNAGAYSARGRYEMIFGELDRAIADYSTAIDLSSGTMRAKHLLDRGIVYSLNGELEKAEADFREGKKDGQFERYNLKYWLELSRRQREARKIKVKLPDRNGN